MFRKYWDPNFIFRNIIIPLAVLILYCFAFALLSTQYIPEGVNTVFVNRFGRCLLIPLAVFSILFFILINTKKSGKLKLSPSTNKFTASDLFLLLLPLTPVIQYILNNQDLLSFTDSLVVLGFFGLFSGIFISIIPTLLGSIGSTKTLKIVGLTFAFTITNMALLSHNFSWLEKGSIKIQLVFFSSVFLVTLFLYNLKNKWILFLAVLAFFLSNGIVQVIEQSTGKDDPTPTASEYKLLPLVKDKIPVTTPNVYLLVYDAYVPNETMLGYGIDNADQEVFLVNQGFEFYPHTYSTFADTLRTMSRVLNASNSIEGNLNSGVSGDGKVVHIFKDLGYETYGIFPHDFMFRGLTPAYDHNFPEFSAPPYTNLISGILMGEFRFDIGFNHQNHSQYVDKKEQLLLDAAGNRSFVYTHSDIPAHSQNSGVCLPDETALYKGRLDQANSEMRQDIKTISENDPSAIIIVAGDHGPYLTKNCEVLSIDYDISEISRLDIQDRYATFLAIRWPTENYLQYDKITILQDLFPAVFAYMFEDPKILDAKLEPTIFIDNVISGANINNGMISGGIDDGEPLFLSGK